jgi:antitoxin (DNA-binding transcriptional repressor) of toxin-antitoxin stability system
MVQVDLNEAQIHLFDLVEKVQQGESVFIRKDENLIVQLVPVARPRGKPQFGCAKGMIAMSDDFDEPLEDKFRWC